MKIAIVTGASSGMGREFVRQIADRFSGIQEIWVIARRKERLEELILKEPVHLRLLTMDLMEKEERQALGEELKKEEPEVKWLINAAGYGKIGQAGDIPLDEETGMVVLNCEALCGVTRRVLPYLTGNSRIVHFASAAAFLPQPGFAVYAATKAFVLSYSRALNEELKPQGIYVTAVCPGPVDTEFFEIAETTGTASLYKRLLIANPKRVVKKAIRDSMMGKPVSVYGFSMKVFRFLCRILPHGLILRIMKTL